MNRLGHITVSEVHGIRRFLYPLSVETVIPDTHRHRRLGLSHPDQSVVPLQVTLGETTGSACRLDFAVSLAPNETIDLLLCTDLPPAVIPDPVRIGAELFRNEQQRFAIEFDPLGMVTSVVYDGVRHLKHAAKIVRNGEESSWISTAAHGPGLPLVARLCSRSLYADGCRAHTRVEITACKSWVNMLHTLETPRPGDQVTFSLPMDPTATIQTCDFGPGGGIYGKLQRDVFSEIVWATEFSDGSAGWSLQTDGRVDYRGRSGIVEYLAQRWCHWIDDDKALAVAIGKVPRECRALKVTLRASGEILVSFRLGDTVADPVTFGLCYHFLNGIPALSAATNPQSILLPPQVSLARISP